MCIGLSLLLFLITLSQYLVLKSIFLFLDVTTTTLTTLAGRLDVWVRVWQVAIHYEMFSIPHKCLAIIYHLCQHISTPNRFKQLLDVNPGLSINFFVNFIINKDTAENKTTPVGNTPLSFETQKAGSIKGYLITGI